MLFSGSKVIFVTEQTLPFWKDKKDRNTKKKSVLKNPLPSNEHRSIDGSKSEFPSLCAIGGAGGAPSGPSDWPLPPSLFKQICTNTHWDCVRLTICGY